MLKFLKQLFSRYRVVEIGGGFIPQKWMWFAWYGLDKNTQYEWYVLEYQVKHCSHETLKDAWDRIDSKRATKIYYERD